MHLFIFKLFCLSKKVALSPFLYVFLAMHFIFFRAINYNSRNAVYYCNRAAAYSRLENHEQALADSKKAVKLDPNYGKAYGRLGYV